MHRSWVCWWLVAGAALPAQDNGAAAPAPQEDPAVARLAADLQRVHRGATAGKTIDRFAAWLNVKQRGKDAEEVTVTLDVKFLRRERDDLIRYEVRGQGRPIQRGRDRKGPWERIDDQVVNLRERHYRQALEKLDSDVRLARQLLRFLDPAGLVAQLSGKSGVTSAQLKVGSLQPIPCLVLEGKLDAFPFYTASGETRSAQVKLWVEEASKRLTAVTAFPLDAQGRAATRGEFVFLMGHHQPSAGVLLPKVIAIDALEGGEHKPAAKVTVTAFEVFPKLSEPDFDR